MRGSLAARLAVVYGLISVIAVTALGLGIYLLTERYLYTQTRADLESLADFYAAYTASTATAEAGLAAMVPQIAGFFAPQADYDLRLFSAQGGTLLATSRPIGPLPSTATAGALHRQRPTLFVATSADLPQRLYVARAVPGANGSPLAVVEISRDMGEVTRFLGILRLALVVAGLLVGLAAVAASLLLARRLTRPLRQVEAATRRIASGDFDSRLAIGQQDEIGRLAASVNHMAADLARLEASRRDFIARISHDLRTPLTAIKGFVVNLQDTAPEDMQPALATIDTQAERLIRLVDDLLLLSRLQREQVALHLTEVDLGDVAHSTVSLAKAKAGRLGVELALYLAADRPTVPGDADRLQQVVVNLVDNALKVTPAGGTVNVHVLAERRELILAVRDQGPGISAEAAARAFEPYVRGPGGGAGLGLTIAREIILAHGGRIWLRDHPEGGAEAGFGLPVR
jgi:signal transduction histidine kinase